jgi:hypothetical protein
VKGIRKMQISRNKDHLLEKYIDEIVDEGRDPSDLVEKEAEINAQVKSILFVANSLKDLKSFHAPHSMKAENNIMVDVRKKSQEQPQSNNIAHHKYDRITFLSPRLIATISLLVFILIICSLLGVTSVSAKSIPGTKLYPLKIAIENWRLKTASSDIEKVNIHLMIADRRLEEANKLLLNGNFEKSVEAMQAYNHQIININKMLDHSFSASFEEHLNIFNKINQWLPNQILELNHLLDNYLEPEEKIVIENSIYVARLSHERMLVLWAEFQESDEFSDNKDKSINLFENKDLKFLEAYINPTYLSLPNLTRTPLSDIKSSINTKTPTAVKDRPLYNKTMTNTPTIKPSDEILPTDMPTPRRTPQPFNRLPTKIIPTSYPTNRPLENPTRTPFLP